MSVPRLHRNGHGPFGAVIKRLRDAQKARFRVSGDSMLPGLPNGSTVTVRQKRIVPGALVVYREGGALVVHRVVAIRQGPGGQVVLTRGDNNRDCDLPIRESQIVGRVVAVERG